MRALILNSGIGKRMGDMTKDRPKCMAEIGAGFTILSWQLYLLQKAGIREAVITTGPFAGVLESYVESLKTAMDIRFVANPEYERTNYIYSIDCARGALCDDDILLLHGDLVFEPSVMDDIIASGISCIAVDAALPLPEKDFKARIAGDRVKAVGIEFFGEDCVACQPIYHMRKKDMQLWLDEIGRFCAQGERGVYAENALNRILDQAKLFPLELNGRLCNEIDNLVDLDTISTRFKKLIESERISV